MGRWWSGSLYRHPGSVGHVWLAALWIITEHLIWTIILRHEICWWMFTGTLNNSSGHVQWWVNTAMGIWELLSGRLGVPLKKVNVKYLRLKVHAGTQCPSYKESPVQLHPQAPDTCYVFGLLSLCMMVYWLFGCIPFFIDFLWSSYIITMFLHNLCQWLNLTQGSFTTIIYWSYYTYVHRVPSIYKIQEAQKAV